MNVIAIIGLGYVGLPLAVEFGKNQDDRIFGMVAVSFNFLTPEFLSC